MTENYTYYDGFEPEPEYIFCLYDNNSPVEKIHIWDGYFCDIIRTVSPAPDGWTSLAEYYNLCIECEQDNWKVPDNAAALEQLSGLDKTKLKFSGSHEVLGLLIDIFKRACENNLTVYIEYF